MKKKILKTLESALSDYVVYINDDETVIEGSINFESLAQEIADGLSAESLSNDINRGVDAGKWVYFVSYNSSRGFGHCEVIVDCEINSHSDIMEIQYKVNDLIGCDAPIMNYILISSPSMSE